MPRAQRLEDESIPRQCARLARNIRRNPERLAAYNYPPRMELATTCCCHTVIEDRNIEDDSVAYCIREAAKHGHAECLQLALLLARGSLTQRGKASHLAWHWLPPGVEEWR